MITKVKAFFSDLKLNDTQGEVILLFGFMCTTKGISLIKDDDSPAPKTLKYVWEHYFLFTNNIFWGICWLITAGFCLIYAFKFDDRPALIVLGALLGGWTFAYLIDWILSIFGVLDAVNFNAVIIYLILLVLIVRWHGRRSGELLERQSHGTGSE